MPFFCLFVQKRYKKRISSRQPGLTKSFKCLCWPHTKTLICLAGLKRSLSPSCLFLCQALPKTLLIPPIHTTQTHTPRCIECCGPDRWSWMRILKDPLPNHLLNGLEASHCQPNASLQNGFLKATLFLCATKGRVILRLKQLRNGPSHSVFLQLIRSFPLWILLL